MASNPLKLVGDEPDLFSYAALSRADEIEVREAAARIKMRLRRTAEDIIEIGRDLLAVKKRLDHGQFLPWLDAEFGMHQTTAARFMQVAEVYGTKVSTVLSMPPTALYELAAPKTPAEVREEVERLIAAGEIVTKATVEELRVKLTGAETAKAGREKAVALAEKEIDKKDAQIAALQSKIDERVAQEVAKAAKQIEKDHKAEAKRLAKEAKDKAAALEDANKALRATIADLRKQPQPVIDNDTGNVVAFHKPLTEEEAAAIDAETDEYQDADFHITASDTDRAAVFFNAIRGMFLMKAKPAAIAAYIMAPDRPPVIIAEYIEKIDFVLNQLNAVKDRLNER